MANPKLKDYSQLDIRADFDMFTEKRRELNGDANPIYLGWTTVAGAAEGALVWFIKKRTYAGTDPNSYTLEELPDEGVGFKYSWTDRATYF